MIAVQQSIQVESLLYDLLYDLVCDCCMILLANKFDHQAIHDSRDLIDSRDLEKHMLTCKKTMITSSSQLVGQ